MSLDSLTADRFAVARKRETDRDGESRNATLVRGQAAFEFVSLDRVPEAAWADLAARAIEPNAFYLPGWARAVDAHATGKSNGRALLVWENAHKQRLIGMAPVASAWRTLKLPLPVLVGWEAYAPLTTPLLDRDAADAAASGLLAAAAQAGAHALLFPWLPIEGLDVQALQRAASGIGAVPRVMARHERASLNAAQDSAALLRDTLGAKKLKELRRQRNRLADAGEVVSTVASEPADVARALDMFLKLEDAGWKGARGTALAQDAATPPSSARR